MACIVYREGKGTVEHGIECESTTCEAEELDSLLSSGWLPVPPGYVPPEPVEAAVEDVDPEWIDDLKTSLDEEIDNLKEQSRVLSDLDEANKSEIARLTREVEAFQGIEIERDNALAEVERLSAVVAAIPAHDVVDDETDSSLNPVRLAAKEAGIEGWDTKRIATLEKALKDLEA